MKAKFIGKSDENFNFDGIYNIIQISRNHYNIDVFLVNKNGKMVFMPYKSLLTFNRNWVFEE